MDDRTATVIAALDRIEQRLLRIAQAGRINAMLELADAGLVLPSPAVSLMAADCGRTTMLGSGGAFRSLDPIGPDGDVWFTPIQPDPIVHPWRVERAEWSPAAERQLEGTAGWARGVRMRLERAADTTCLEGPLQIGILADVDLECELGAARLCHADAVWPHRPLAVPLEVIGGRVPADALPAHDAVESVCRAVLAADVPRGALRETALDLEIRFREPVRARGPIALFANAMPVWNSRHAVYPDAEDVGQAVSEIRHRLVHPLVPRGLGRGWSAWAVRDVIAVGGEARVTRRGLGAVPLGSGFHLAFVPCGAAVPDGTDVGAGEPVLAVVLDDAGRAAVDRRGGRVRVEYQATAGAAGNGVPRGTEFMWLEGGAFLDGARVRGELMATSGGGANAVEPVENPMDSAAERAGAWWARSRIRSVGDVATALRARYGDEFSLVDEWDLLRRSGTEPLRPLMLRIRFLHPDRPAWERRAVLRSARHFLERYAKVQDFGGLRVVDVEGGTRGRA